MHGAHLNAEGALWIISSGPEAAGWLAVECIVSGSGHYLGVPLREVCLRDQLRDTVMVGLLVGCALRSLPLQADSSLDRTQVVFDDQAKVVLANLGGVTVVQFPSVTPGPACTLPVACDSRAPLGSLYLVERSPELSIRAQLHVPYPAHWPCWYALLDYPPLFERMLHAYGSLVRAGFDPAVVSDWSIWAPHADNQQTWERMLQTFTQLVEQGMPAPDASFSSISTLA